MRPRHSDADLLELAAAGSAPAFASLLHRHRDVVQRGALRAERPEEAAVAALVAAVRDLRRGGLRADALRQRLSDLVEDVVRPRIGRPGVERLLPTDWFDRAWVRAELHWPSGRRPVRVPRGTGYVLGALLLAALGSIGTFLVMTADVTTEVVSELVAEPLEDGDAPASTVPADGTDDTVVPEGSPELLGEVELGDLPTYDLTGGGQGDAGPTIGPASPADGAAGTDAAG